MDEKDLVKVGMEVALRPITNIAENALGLLGGDWLSDKRQRNRERLRQRTEEVLKERDLRVTDDPSPSVMTPLLSAAQDEGREELVDIWANLVATAMSAQTAQLYRRSFVEVAKGLEPVDSLVLKLLNTDATLVPNREYYVANQLSVSLENVELIFGNLTRLELIKRVPGLQNPRVSSLGIMFLAAAAPDMEKK